MIQSSTIPPLLLVIKDRVAGETTIHYDYIHVYLQYIIIIKTRIYIFRLVGWQRAFVNVTEFCLKCASHLQLGGGGGDDYFWGGRNRMGILGVVSPETTPYIYAPFPIFKDFKSETTIVSKNCSALSPLTSSCT